jgi:hypothetical protein
MRRFTVTHAKTRMSARTSVYGCLICGLVALALTAFPQAAVAQKTAITTYHYNNGRTGWNSAETTLTPANVASASFGMLESIALDGEVSAQPLVVPNQQINAGSYQGTHNVVYVATQNNTIYAIDYDTGTVLLSPNFGTPVPNPITCPTDPVVGINSTPVLNLPTNTMYVMIYTNESNGPVYRLHALGLGSLTDQMAPVVVSASHTLTDGTTYAFNATYEHQRPALLLASGNVYAGFGSFCDKGTSDSRGWLLGWEASTLTPLAMNQVLDTQATSPHNYFLSSIWMSGAGVAADPSGNVYFITGNSDPSGTTYDGVTNIQESLIKTTPDLSQVLDLFTPMDVATMDQNDRDFSSGGVMLLPPRPTQGVLNPIPNLVVAADKDGDMFLMNQENLGGYDPNANNVLGQYPIGTCFCVPSYFVDPIDGTPRVVVGGGAALEVWKLQTHPTVALTNVANSGPLFTRNHGFFTTVSSNGFSNPIIWALGRQTFKTPAMTFYAFNPEVGGGTLKPIFTSQSAGTWAYNGNANQVPVVANGKVFIASGQQLTIFGIGAKLKTTNPNSVAHAK